MAVQNCIGDSFRGATWVAIHNGGGCGWGNVINGGFGLVLDGSKVILFYTSLTRSVGFFLTFFLITARNKDNSVIVYRVQSDLALEKPTGMVRFESRQVRRFSK